MQAEHGGRGIPKREESDWGPRIGSGGDAHSLAASLAPALLAECGGRLSPIEWFRSTWQRGGSATGFARWTGADGTHAQVLVKLPVGPVEHRWTTRLGREAWGSDAHLPPTPRVAASGRSIGGYDLCWLVMERLEGHPLSAEWDRGRLDDLLRATVGFQQLAASEPLSEPGPAPPDWPSLLERSREACRRNDVPDAQRWNEALKRIGRILPRLAASWGGRTINSWCHGDLHPGNAIRRVAASDPGIRPGCVLIDLAFVHPGHWIEDAVYLERQFWSHPERLFGVHPVSVIARLRREAGLPADDDYGGLANVRRVLMASCVPALLEREGSARYAQAALELIHKVLPQVGG